MEGAPSLILCGPTEDPDPEGMIYLSGRTAHYVWRALKFLVLAFAFLYVGSQLPPSWPETLLPPPCDFAVHLFHYALLVMVIGRDAWRGSALSRSW